MSTTTTDRAAGPRAGPRCFLLVEDDPVDVRMIQRTLAALPEEPPELRRASTLAEGLAHAGGDDVDMILLDLGLPDGCGIGNVQQMLRSAPTTPVVVLTGLDDERTAAESVRLGAQDYLVKDSLDARSLVKSLRFAAQRHQLLRELELARSQENEIKDRFLSHVSHELRTPLTAIMQFVTILLDGIAGPLAPQQAEYLAIVQRNAEQLKRMIGTLMDVTRADAGKLSHCPQRVAAAPILTGAVDTVTAQADEKRIRIRLVADDHLPDLVADPGRLNQVLINLLGNAVKFTAAGGTIRVSARIDPSRRDLLLVSVQDDGCGIPADALDKVFDRLYQVGPQSDLSRNGLGLGLHICREIVRLHGGRIWAESRIGEGSTFHFTVPTYSTASFLRRVAVAGGVVQPAVTLVSVAVRARTATARSRGAGSVVGEVSRVLANCMLGASDAVLPTMRCTPERGTVYGLARADRTGAAAIGARLRAELDQHPRFGRWGFDLAVETECFEVATAGTDPGAALAAAARRLDANMDGKNRGSS